MGDGMPSRVLGVQVDEVVDAAGALDKLVAQFGSTILAGRVDSPDAGHPDMTEALSDFSTLWVMGLETMLASQTDRAAAIRKAVETLVGVDVDVEYAFRNPS